MIIIKVLYYVLTFISLLNKDISLEFEFPQSYRIMSDSVSRAFIKECIDEINPKYFRTEKNDPS